MVDADPVRLAQVLTNLLNNAARYTDPGGLVRLDAEVAGRDLKINISDTGAGIPQDAQERIFNMFEQLTDGTRAPGGGLGIGLALAKAIVNLHGGSILVHSEGVGKGSEFAVSLPGVVQAGSRPA